MIRGQITCGGIPGAAAAFVLVNSIAGIAGVMVGGYVGAEYGSRRLGNPTIQRLLAKIKPLRATRIRIEAI